MSAGKPPLEIAIGLPKKAAAADEEDKADGGSDDLEEHKTETVHALMEALKTDDAEAFQAALDTYLDLHGAG